MSSETIATKVGDVLTEQLELAERADRRRQLKRLATITLVTLIVALAAAVALSQRPPIGGTLRTTVPSAGSEVVLRGFPEGQLDIGEAQVSEMLLSASPFPRRNANTIAEMVLPVPPSACRQLVEDLGGSCGRLAGGPVRLTAPASISWSKGALLSLSLDAARELRIAPPPRGVPPKPLSSWTLAPKARVLALRIDCLEPSLITIAIRPGKPLHTRCLTSHASNWSARFHFTDQPSGLRLAMLALSSLRLHAHPRTAHLTTNRSMLRIGDSMRSLQSHDGVNLMLGTLAASNLDFNLRATDRPDRVHMAIDSNQIAAATAMGVQLIPTVYKRHREFCLALLFAVFAGLATAWLDRFILLR